MNSVVFQIQVVVSNEKDDNSDMSTSEVNDEVVEVLSQKLWFYVIGIVIYFIMNNFSLSLIMFLQDLVVANPYGDRTVDTITIVLIFLLVDQS